MDWEEAACRLESRLDLSRIPRNVIERLDRLESVYLACSGGADSVFALLLLRSYLVRQKREGSLCVLHFDHALRGQASVGDAAFVRQMADALGIQFMDAQAEWTGDLDQVSEATAREARLAFFRQASGACEARPAWICTGHHADDVVETMLMRLSRGAGLQGLCAPRDVSGAGSGLHFLRPILDWGRDELRKELQLAEVPWREDESNRSDKNYRARLRKEAVPAWERAADRPLRKGVGRSRCLLAEDAEALDAAAAYFWRQCWDESETALDRRQVASLPRGLQRRLLLLMPGGAGVAAEALELALAAVQAGDPLKLDVGQGSSYQFSADWLRISKTEEGSGFADWEAFTLPIGTIAYLPDGARVSAERLRLDGALREKIVSGSNDDAWNVYLDDRGNQSDRLWVRKRAPGDAFKPFGKSSPKKLKKLFIDRKIDRMDRDRLPVFVSEESGILWVPGIPPYADGKLGFGSDAALRLTYVR